MHLQFKAKIKPKIVCVPLKNAIKPNLSPLIVHFLTCTHFRRSVHYHPPSLSSPLPAPGEGFVYFSRQRLCRWMWVYWFSLCTEEGFPSCWGLRGDVLSVLHLSHSGLSCLSTPSPVWPRFRGTDVNHRFAISKLNIDIGGVRLFGFGLVCGSTSSCRVFHLMMNNFQCENEYHSKLRVFLCVQEQSETYLWLEFDSESVWPCRGVLRFQSQRSELGVYGEQPEDGTHTQYRHRKSTRARNGVNWQRPSSVVNHSRREQYWDINSTLRFITPGTDTATLHQDAAPYSRPNAAGHNQRLEIICLWSHVKQRQLGLLICVPLQQVLFNEEILRMQMCWVTTETHRILCFIINL